MKKLVVTLDPRKLQTTIIADSTIVTNFVYNALGELIQSTDPNNHSTFYTYNNFGQKTSRIHPDAGTDLFTYDLAGNLISRQTQDLINNSMTINYDYYYNQMTAIHYPKNPENDVHYFYGDNSATDNRKGRVYAIEDASGRQEFSYGRMGEVVKNIRTFALPNEQNTYTFTMKFEYDSWNRILGTTYPDGEHVRYWKGYTKHYYAGSERVIGVLFDAHEFRLDKLYFYKNAESGKMDRYFYHPDHLGSSSWITDNTGRPIQHLHYLPFGEDWVDQRNTSWNAPYTFSSKEKDVETGYGYFGARYYDSGLSIWLSVDPMSDKYPSMSPYNYCANNPVKLIDPNGMEFVDNDGGPDGPMGRGDGPAPNQTRNKPVTTQWHTPGQDKMNNSPSQQSNTKSQSGSTPTNSQAGNTNNQSNTSSTVSNATFGVALETTMVSVATEGSTVATTAAEAASAKVFTNVAKVSKGVGIAGGVVSTAVAAVELYNNPTTGNYVKTFVNAASVGAAFIPGFGTAISIGLTGFDYFFGEQFYNWLDK